MVAFNSIRHIENIKSLIYLDDLNNLRLEFLILSVIETCLIKNF